MKKTAKSLKTFICPPNAVSNPDISIISMGYYVGVRGTNGRLDIPNLSPMYGNRRTWGTNGGQIDDFRKGNKINALFGWRTSRDKWGTNQNHGNHSGGHGGQMLISMSPVLTGQFWVF